MAIMVIPWSRVPEAFHVLVPFAYLGAVYLVQSATGGPYSSYGQLALLPVFWVAVFGRPRELGLVVLGAGVALGAPVVVAGGNVHDWARLATLLSVGTGMALLVYRFFDGLRHQTTRLQVLATRDGRPVCVALVDLDDFKGFNDSNGHQAGDRLLRQVAGAWQNQLRASDILARIGGDEFGILLPGCPLDMAATIVRRLRDSVPAARCSIGVAEWDHREPVERLVARVDAALYEAKAAGRDRVVILPETGSTGVLPDRDAAGGPQGPDG
jgi:diguanylate cyclase (GGDEF)-like protein